LGECRKQYMSSEIGDERAGNCPARAYSDCCERPGPSAVAGASALRAAVPAAQSVPNPRLILFD
jgi:hypothetical protein